jgi:dihydroneopterin aldolase
MQDDIMAQRITGLAAAARISLQESAATRIANAIGGTLSRIRQAQIELPLEIEPSSFVVVQHGEIGA